MGSSESTLRLGEIKPALEGAFKVKTSTGQTIEVTTVFEMIKREVEKFSPEKTQKYTGIHPSVIYNEARKFAAAKKAIVLMGYRVHKYFWGVLTCWEAALCLRLQDMPAGGAAWI